MGSDIAKTHLNSVQFLVLFLKFFVEIIGTLIALALLLPFTLP